MTPRDITTPRPTEEYTDPAAFVAAQKPKSKRKKAKESRPDIPRAPMGVGDRHAALDRLAHAGYGGVAYLAATDEYYCIGPAGETPRCATYHAAIDAALKHSREQR